MRRGLEEQSPPTDTEQELHDLESFGGAGELQAVAAGEEVRVHDSMAADVDQQAGDIRSILDARIGHWRQSRNRVARWRARADGCFDWDDWR